MIKLVVKIKMLFKLKDLHDMFTSATIWVAFGTGRNFRYYNINSIIRALGVNKSQGVPFFHTLSGFDTSQFHGKGKNQYGWKPILL